MIYLEGLQTQKVKVKVVKDELLKGVVENFDLSDLYKVTRSVFYREMKLPNDAFVKDGKWYVEVEYYGSHSWYNDKYLRDVTEPDKVLLGIIENLNVVKEVE